MATHPVGAERRLTTGSQTIQSSDTKALHCLFASLLAMTANKDSRRLFGASFFVLILI
jgi:hypothetical protein